MRWVIIAAICVGAASCAKKEQQTSEETMTEQTSPVAAEHAEQTEQAVTFEALGLTIHGTISKPLGEGPFPAIVVAAGSGPTTRDWTSPMLPGSNGSGKLLADALAERGIVLLRYDKRGIGETGMPTNPVQWNDYATELSVAVETLAAKPYVDAGRVYVAGHSEGGVHAMMVAQAPPVPLAGLLLLSTAGRTLRDVVLGQISPQIEASGLNPAAAKAEIDALTQALDRIAAGETVDVSTVGQLPGVQQFLAALQDPMSVEFARGLLTFDPAAAVRQVKVPSVLVLTGERDIQIDPQLDAYVLVEALAVSDPGMTYALIDDADHVLKSEEMAFEELTPERGLYYNAEGRTLSQGAVDAIAQFVRAE